MRTPDLPARARGLARRVVRTKPAAGTTAAETNASAAAPTTSATPSPTLSRWARPVPAPVGASPLPTRVALAGTRRLADLLAPEWQQTTLDRMDGASSLAGTDLVLLQATRGDVPGWEGAADALLEVVTAARGQGIPVAVWVTSAPVPDEDWLRAATAVGVSTTALHDATAAVLQDPVREVHLWQPAAQPRTSGLAREDATTARRSESALVVLDGLTNLTDGTHLAEVVAPALAKLRPAETPVVRIAGKSAMVTPPALLTERQVAEGPWDAVGGALGDARVLLDLGNAAATAPWTSMAAAMAGTPLVGTSGLGSALPAEIDALVPRVDEQQALRSELVARMRQEELVAREGLRLRRAVLAGHTAGHRAATILTAAGRETPAPYTNRSISAVVPTNRVHELDNVMANLGRQSHADTELVLVLHGLADHPEIDDADLRRRATQAGAANLTIVHADPSLTLGACMNLGVDAAGGRYVAKMDDDNFYGEHYLADLVDAFASTDAGIVGKWCHYVWLRSTGAVVLRYPDSEQRYERRIQGGSMLFDGDVVRRIRFSDIPRAVDSDILDRSMAEGVRVWSGDRYNYVSIRGTDRTAHTWTVTDSTFMTATGRLLFYGDPREHVSV